MILPGQTIRAIRPHIVTPFNERQKFRGMSYGLSVAGYDVRIDQDVWLNTGDFKLGSTIERFEMPYDVLGIVHDKSTWARLGLAVQNTVIEPGWKGYLTVELTNHGPHAIDIPRGCPIAQIIFHRCEAPVETPYQGKYQDQPAKPVPALYE